MTEAQDLQRRADELGDQLAALSGRAGASATRRLQVRLAVLRQDLLRLWVLLFGSVDAHPVDPAQAGSFAASAVNHFTAAMDPALVDSVPVLEAWLAAYGFGVESTGAVWPEDFTSGRSAPPLDLQHPVTEHAAHAVSGLSQTAILALGFAAVTVALSRAQRAVTRVDDVVSFELTRAASTAVTDVARAQGTGRIWVAERDACVHCLAYAGVTTTSAVFPSGLTFGDKPLLPPGPLLGPPLHPNCRCVIQLFDPSDTAVSVALKREARRSIVRGWSLESESAASRLRAAERLLARGAGLPKTVEEYGRSAVRRGEFPRGRDVPAGVTP